MKTALENQPLVFEKKNKGRPRLEYECGCGNPPTHKRGGALCCDRCAEIEERFLRENSVQKLNALRLNEDETAYLDSFTWADKRLFDVKIAAWWDARGMRDPGDDFNQYNQN